MTASIRLSSDDNPGSGPVRIQVRGGLSSLDYDLEPERLIRIRLPYAMGAKPFRDTLSRDQFSGIDTLHFLLNRTPACEFTNRSYADGTSIEIIREGEKLVCINCETLRWDGDSLRAEDGVTATCGIQAWRNVIHIARVLERGPYPGNNTQLKELP